MIKHLILLLLLSIGIVMAMPYAAQGILALVNAHDWIAQGLSDVFSAGHAGNIAKQLIALLCIPIAAGLIPAVFYYLFRRHWFPYFMNVVWVVWLVQAGALIMRHKTGG
jgi:hypothetical protein